MVFTQCRRYYSYITMEKDFIVRQIEILLHNNHIFTHQSWQVFGKNICQVFKYKFNVCTYIRICMFTSKLEFCLCYDLRSFLEVKPFQYQWHFKWWIVNRYQNQIILIHVQILITLHKRNKCLKNWNFLCLNFFRYCAVNSFTNLNID